MNATKRYAVAKLCRVRNALARTACAHENQGYSICAARKRRLGAGGYAAYLSEMERRRTVRHAAQAAEAETARLIAQLIVGDRRRPVNIDGLAFTFWRLRPVARDSQVI